MTPDKEKISPYSKLHFSHILICAGIQCRPLNIEFILFFLLCMWVSRVKKVEWGISQGSNSASCGGNK